MPFHFVFTSQTAGLIFHVSKSKNLFLAQETSSNIISGLLMNPSPLVRVTESHSSRMVNRVIHIRAWLSVCCLFQSSSQARTRVTHAHNSYHSKSSVMLPDTGYLALLGSYSTMLVMLCDCEPSVTFCVWIAESTSNGPQLCTKNSLFIQLIWFCIVWL